MARSAITLLYLLLLTGSAALATTSSTTCNFEGVVMTDPSNCAVVADSDGGAYATATAYISSGVDADVGAFASATLHNISDTSATQLTDTASAYVDATTTFYSAGPFRLGLISLDYDVITTGYDFGNGNEAETLIVSDRVHTYNFSQCPPLSGDGCYGFELLPFDLGTTFTVTAIASVSPVYIYGDAAAYVDLTFTLNEAANGAGVAAVIPEPGTVWLLAVAALFIKAGQVALLLKPAKA